MSNIKDWLVVVNPVSGNQKGLLDWSDIEQKLIANKFDFQAHFTEKRSDATNIVKKYIESGGRKIIAVGGDGTLNEIVNGVVSQNHCSPCDVGIGIIPVGSGNDWCKMFAIPSDYSKAIEIIKMQQDVFHDVGYVKFNEGKETRYFVNVAGLGFDAAVVANITRKKETKKGKKTSYLLSLITSLMAYKKQPASILVDDVLIDDKVFSMNVGICKYSGGGMMQVPFAVHDDNLLDVTIIKNISKFDVVRNIKKLYDGSFTKHPKVETLRGQKITINSTDKFLLEADGEILGKSPFEFGIIHKHIRFFVNIL